MFGTFGQLGLVHGRQACTPAPRRRPYRPRLEELEPRCTPAAVTEFPVLTANSGPEGITAGPDGALWFTENRDKIGRITTGGAVTEFALPARSSPQGIAAGPDGALWFTEVDGNKIGRIT